MELDEATLRTFSSAVDTILPGSSKAGIDVKVAQLFDSAMQGYPLMVVSLLDAFADDVRKGVSFTDLTDDERGKVFNIMRADASADVRDVVDGLFLFGLGQNYSEAHPDHEQVWARIGYHGPSKGEPDA